MISRRGRIVLIALLTSTALGAMVGGVPQLTAVSTLDPREGRPIPTLEPTPTIDPESSAASSSSAPPAPEPSRPWLYTIQVGESISSIAIRFGTTTEALIALNPEYSDNEDLINAGASMIIPCTPLADAEGRC